MNATAQATSPGPAPARSAVPATHATVVAARARFFAACASAHAPTMGPATITIA